MQHMESSKPERVDPTVESVNSAIQAYTTLPFVSALLLAFVTAQNPPCISCQHQGVVNAVAIISSICVAFSLISISTSLLLIYQASKLLSSRGPSVASTYLKSTSLFREVARYSTYVALISFVTSFGVCLAGTSQTYVAWLTSIILIAGVVCIIVGYQKTRKVFNDLLHVPGN